MRKDTTHAPWMPPGATLRNRPHQINSVQSGFTLIGLLVAIAVLVVMVTWAVPSYQQFVARNELSVEVMRLRTALAQAKNTAITRRGTITVCPSHDQVECLADWAAPLMILEGRAEGGYRKGTETILRVLSASDVASITFRNDYRYVRFPSTGWPRGYNGTFDICGRGGQGVQLIMSNLGRIRHEHTNC
ncbi:GspH/FimT family pseudopilin [Modicisalibacter luteus]|uniref:Type II secretion system protein H n=2 Tax=Modicisalibacter luteus TaxID=453962 RepID=A0ABV7LXU0_9GAMM